MGSCDCTSQPQGVRNMLQHLHSETHLLDMKKNLAECLVCHQETPKARVHYGGVSCYSCRAFFSRNTQRADLPLCKGEGSCNVTHKERKQCAACRYQKCLLVGMKRELVLNEDEKKVRFKKL